MMAKRRWINTSVTAGYCYWNCPGPICDEVFWWKIPSASAQCECKTCEFKYEAIRREDTRLLIEVKE